ncbi:hypothetical protein pEaSNUABM56_00024 [Erwinia phage pEa_SNUABM_56]|uniref:Uncharacterized protein n=1 Tax=Erwinia phage pEp_SNUABM_01 TaxID=2601643 RepID=A0A5J6DB25_9CAUD|nr:hypothetical protein HWC63_gp104 [Erwinia phage pEp_SNUABM_01]QEQ95074.1 hypothetical protein pEpSNUABM01_248 [Erwinia phage pEp_SNUABM_01]UYL85002.1 hypothetical protein pEaSNUABM55_00229 [Erwinia phage pEa_SNUABM_55]UYL85069.1 hypothetical protein pEaSNUABM56_00024 [Erwinia phage pEa_SNUABM_56]
MTIFYVKDKAGMTKSGEAEGTQEGIEAAAALNASEGFRIVDVGLDGDNTVFVTNCPMVGNRIVVLRFEDLQFIAPQITNSL